MKTKLAGRIENDGTKDVEVKVPLKYLSNFCGTLEEALLRCRINLILTWSANCFTIIIIIFFILGKQIYSKIVAKNNQKITEYQTIKQTKCNINKQNKNVKPLISSLKRINTECNNFLINLSESKMYLM